MQTLTIHEETINEKKKQLVIIGNGMVGHHCVEQLIERGATSTYQIHVFGDERHRAYDRVHLSEYFSGKDADALALGEANLHETHGVSLHLGVRITEIDRDRGEVITSEGRLPYDSLIIATGSWPFVPPIPGPDAREHPQARLVYRTLDDLDAIRDHSAHARRGVVIGGGLLGLEAANALKSLGLEAHVVEFAPRLMPVQLDDQGGAALRERIEALGVGVHTGCATEEIIATPDNDYAYRMRFKSGEHLDTDLVLFSAGIRPQDQLARDCGLEVGERGGIVIDETCRTSDPEIFAIGECALWNGQVFGLVAPGYTMARTVAGCLTEVCEPFNGADMSTRLKLLGVDVGSIGDAFGTTEGSKSYRYIDEAGSGYRRLVVSNDGKKALGAVLVGDNSYYDTLLQYVQNGIGLPEDPAVLILPQSEGGVPTLGADALPDTAMVCSCHNVTKGAICQAVDEGCADIAALKIETKASTGCGGCAALLKQVFEHELESRGIEVDKSLCEHFHYTRQELYAMVRVEGITSFDELLEKHGHGLGCDICKPTIGSILATCWNQPIMDPQNVALQDTNDTFMANMQKNGTYSVMPRIAGGEITPDKLVALGQVAQKFDLYTKITGGQRIDLFGAELHELPDIWEELINAGFETGHAYGKSLRTVKSCVGNTWCRYGVQDSVAMALELEHRYKGLRTPHKVKMGVSGCTRECAEAQGKDIGVIATEAGWNLYVCGNGGMRPRHAELFATDIDSDTLIRYVDRFLMFYVRTADKLQRTSVWRESLEGGLDFLKDVIINDSLGLGDELERQMQHVVSTYECEWANALKDPEKLKRFRTFVNDKCGDPAIVNVTERGQPRPARADEIQSLAVEIR